MKVSKIRQSIVIAVRQKKTWAAPYTISLLIMRADYLALHNKISL